jgi:hypothetical protein
MGGVPGKVLTKNLNPSPTAITTIKFQPSAFSERLDAILCEMKLDQNMSIDSKTMKVTSFTFIPLMLMSITPIIFGFENYFCGVGSGLFSLIQKKSLLGRKFEKFEIGN